MKTARSSVLAMAALTALAFSVPQSISAQSGYGAPPRPQTQQPVSGQNKKGANAGPMQDKERGAKEAPAAVQAAGLSCTITEAAFLGSNADPADKAKLRDLYEVACKEGLGYLIIKPQGAGTTPTVFDCVNIETVAQMNEAAGKPVGVRCALEANKKPYLGLQSYIAETGYRCTVSNARYIGDTSTGRVRYEVGCSEGPGAVLERARSGTEKATAFNCLRAAGAGQYSCQYTPREKAVLGIAALASQAQRECAVSDVRFVGQSTTTQGELYEVGCTGRPGFLMELKPEGAFSRALDCPLTGSVQCKLTDVQALQAARKGEFQQRLRTAGSDCIISDFRFLGPETGTGREVIEAACSNRPEGVAAILGTQKGQAHEVYDCLRAPKRGLACTLTQPAAVYPRLSQAMNAKFPSGRAACTVNGARRMGTTPQGEDWFDVTCADGRSYVVDWRGGSTGVARVLTCREATEVLGGCKAGSTASQPKS